MRPSAAELFEGFGNGLDHPVPIAEANWAPRVVKPNETSWPLSKGEWIRV